MRGRGAREVERSAARTMRANGTGAAAVCPAAGGALHKCKEEGKAGFFQMTRIVKSGS